MAENPVGNMQGSDPPPHMPGSRALQAIETAVLRVRESRGDGSGPTKVREAPREPSVPPPPSDFGPGEPAENRGAPRFTSLGILALLIAIAVVVLVPVLAGGPSSKPASAGSSAPAHRPAHPHSTGSPNSSGAVPAASTPALTPSTVPSPPVTAQAPTTTPAPVPNPASGVPVITSLAPASGSPGQQIVVVGNNFLSSSGQIVGAFNGQAAPTSCPTQGTCTLTVPAPPGGPAAQVTITTSTGTSNAVTFTYGAAAPPPPPTTVAGSPPVAGTPSCATPPCAAPSTTEATKVSKHPTKSGSQIP
jgi:hypothetical protein